MRDDFYVCGTGWKVVLVPERGNTGKEWFWGGKRDHESDHGYVRSE